MDKICDWCGKSFSHEAKLEGGFKLPGQRKQFCSRKCKQEWKDSRK